MNQAAFLASFDRDAFDAFFASGLADRATYAAPADPDADPEAPAPAPVDCTVLVDRDVRDFGDDAAPVATAATLVTFRRAEVTPETGGTVTLAGGEAFSLVHQVREDESISRWAVEVANG